MNRTYTAVTRTPERTMSVDPHDPSRRKIVVGGLAVAALSVATSPTQTPTVVSGVVYHQRTSSGVRSLDDPGVPNVLVSNGVDVVRTDSHGRWQLPAHIGDHVFVIKPSDWSSAISVSGLQSYSRRIDAEGLKGSIDFGLRPRPEPRRFDVALLADTQPQSLEELGYLRDSVLPVVMETRAAFAINHGDIVFDRPDFYARYLDLITGTGMPWHHCPGNHDMNSGGPAQCFETWRATFGPCYAAFQYGGATFIQLNNVVRLPDGDVTEGGYDYIGRIGREQLTFVDRLLRLVPRDQLVVVSMHIPLIGWEDALEPSGYTVDRHALLALLSGRPNTLSLAGHTHTTEHHYLGAEDGFAGPGTHHHHVLTAACGSWWSGPFDVSGQPIALSRDGTPKGIHVLEVDGASYRTRLVPIGHSGSPHMRISLEGREFDSADGAPRRTRLTPCLSTQDCKAAALSVNVFDGGPRTVLAGRIVGRTNTGRNVSQAIELTRNTMSDVTVDELYRLNRAQVKPWVEAATSSHIWRGALPSLPTGTYAIHVDGRDGYGTPLGSNLVFEVIG
jgi:hypothetical protein